MRFSNWQNKCTALWLIILTIVGLALAVAEMAVASGIGAHINALNDANPIAVFYGEDQGRYLVATDDGNALVEAAMAAEGGTSMRLPMRASTRWWISVTRAVLRHSEASTTASRGTLACSQVNAADSSVER